MPFSALALKENIFFDVDTLFQNISFVLFLYAGGMLSDLAKVFERKV